MKKEFNLQRLLNQEKSNFHNPMGATWGEKKNSRL